MQSEASKLICAAWRDFAILCCLEESRSKAVLQSNHSHPPLRGSRLKKLNFIFDNQAEMYSNLVCSHQEAVWRGPGQSRACSLHGGEGQQLHPACGSRLPSSAHLRSPWHSPCSDWSSPCLGIPSASLSSPWKDRSSPLKGRGSLLKDQSSPWKEGGILWRGPGSQAWVDPGSLWCSLCALQIPAWCPACSLKKVLSGHYSPYVMPCLVELIHVSKF